MAELFVGKVFKTEVRAGKNGPFLNVTVMRKTDEWDAEKNFFKSEFVRGVIFSNVEQMTDLLQKDTLVCVYGTIGTETYQDRETNETKISPPKFLGDHAFYLPGLNDLGEPALILYAGKPPKTEGAPVQPKKGVVVEPAPTLPADPAPDPVFPSDAPSPYTMQPAQKLAHEKLTTTDPQIFDIYAELRDKWFPGRPGKVYEMLSFGQAQWLIDKLDEAKALYLNNGTLPSRDTLIANIKQWGQALGAPTASGLLQFVTNLPGKFSEVAPQLSDAQLHAVAVAFQYTLQPASV